jgi:hypothetical protein
VKILDIKTENDDKEHEIYRMSHQSQILMYRESVMHLPEKFHDEIHT